MYRRNACYAQRIWLGWVGWEVGAVGRLGGWAVFLPATRSQKIFKQPLLLMMASQMKPEDKLWFFLKESMALPTYVQKQYTLRDVQQWGLSLADCLKITSCRDTDLTKYAFYMHSASMAAAVRLLSDESILTTFNLYCQKDPVVTVLIRAAEDLSPNTSRAPSHQSSLAERRKISGRRIVSEIFIQPKIRHISGSTDASTMAPIADIGESGKVTLQLEGGRFETFTKEYLLCKSQSINVFTLRPRLLLSGAAL
jgi:hypothetical protein